MLGVCEINVVYYFYNIFSCKKKLKNIICIFYYIDKIDFEGKNWKIFYDYSNIIIKKNV